MTPDLLERLRVDRRRVRSMVALHAARVLLVQPQQFEQMTAVDLLLEIPYVKPERADKLLRAAGVYPLRRGAQLRDDQRRNLARELTTFAKGEA